jgi:acyl carrier protein
VRQSVFDQGTMERLQGIFRAVFDDGAIVINENTAPEEIAGWDSLAQIKLILLIKKSFAIDLTLKDIREMRDVSSILELIQRKSAK